MLRVLVAAEARRQEDSSELEEYSKQASTKLDEYRRVQEVSL
jgi:hypothetical protein